MDNKQSEEIGCSSFLVAIIGVILCIVGCQTHNTEMTIFGAALIIGF